jgi:hypothetical protein
MTQVQYEARIAELEAKLAQAQKSKTKISLSDAGYIEVHGIPGKGRFSVSNTLVGWEAIFAMRDEIGQFLKANGHEATKRQTDYLARKNQAVG